MKGVVVKKNKEKGRTKSKFSIFKLPQFLSFWATFYNVWKNKLYF